MKEEAQVVGEWGNTGATLAMPNADQDRVVEKHLGSVGTWPRTRPSFGAFPPTIGTLGHISKLGGHGARLSGRRLRAKQ